MSFGGLLKAQGSLALVTSLRMAASQAGLKIHTPSRRCLRHSVQKCFKIAI